MERVVLVCEREEDGSGGVDGRVGGSERGTEGERRSVWRRREVESFGAWELVGLRERAPRGVEGRDGDPSGV
jgi:hypothetical protein